MRGFEWPDLRPGGFDPGCRLARSLIGLGGVEQDVNNPYLVVRAQSGR
jgi:hypothetical protein